YNSWDVDPGDVVEWDSCTPADKGKLIMFDDGSEWYTKILNVCDSAVKTETGTYKRADFVHCCNIKWPGGFYSGVPAKEEHPLVRAYTQFEKAMSTRMIRGSYPKDKTPSKRILMLTVEKLQEQITRYGVNEEWAIAHLKKWVETGNRHAYQALSALMRIEGVELNQQTGDGGKKPVPLFQQFNQNITIQEARRQETLPPPSEIRDLIRMTQPEEAEVIMEYESPRHLKPGS
ncbi:MAG: hypothetical protein ACYC3W_10535, partial [Candidatus Nanopelagicales bacterium]